MKKKYDKYKSKMSPEELEQYLQFRRRGFAVPAKKGGRAYDRKRFKREREED